MIESCQTLNTILASKTAPSWFAAIGTIAATITALWFGFRGDPSWRAFKEENSLVMTIELRKFLFSLQRITSTNLNKDFEKLFYPFHEQWLKKKKFLNSKASERVKVALNLSSKYYNALKTIPSQIDPNPIRKEINSLLNTIDIELKLDIVEPVRRTEHFKKRYIGK